MGDVLVSVLVSVLAPAGLPDPAQMCRYPSLCRHHLSSCLSWATVPQVALVVVVVAAVVVSTVFVVVLAGPLVAAAGLGALGTALVVLLAAGLTLHVAVAVVPVALQGVADILDKTDTP